MDNQLDTILGGGSNSGTGTATDTSTMILPPGQIPVQAPSLPSGGGLNGTATILTGAAADAGLSAALASGTAITIGAGAGAALTAAINSFSDLSAAARNALDNAVNTLIPPANGACP